MSLVLAALFGLGYGPTLVLTHVIEWTTGTQVPSPKVPGCGRQLG